LLMELQKDEPSMMDLILLRQINFDYVLDELELHS
jgi:hypothetical protein